MTETRQARRQREREEAKAAEVRKFRHYFFEDAEFSVYADRLSQKRRRLVKETADARITFAEIQYGLKQVPVTAGETTGTFPAICFHAVQVRENGAGFDARQIDVVLAIVGDPTPPERILERANILLVQFMQRPSYLVTPTEHGRVVADNLLAFYTEIPDLAPFTHKIIGPWRPVPQNHHGFVIPKGGMPDVINQDEMEGLAQTILDSQNSTKH